MNETAVKERTAYLDTTKIVEATLELGRNWSIAVAVAALGAAAWHSEGIVGLWRYREALLITSSLFAFFWILIAIARFLIVVDVKTKSWAQTAVAYAIILVLLTVGVGLIVSAGSYADNARAVAVCSEVSAQPESRTHQHLACQSLYKLRAERKGE